MDDPVTWLTDVKDRVIPEWLDDTCEALLADPELKVVGFSCLSFQTMASLALAKRLKERRPGLRTVFGGASFHRSMGEEFIAKLDFIDAVATGEADQEIVPLFRALLVGEVPADLPGIHCRVDGMVLKGPPPHMAPAEVLEELPDPVFDDYFGEVEAMGLMDDYSFRDRIFIPYEASRGCWWGEIKHCTYCGLNAEGMDFRHKSSERALDSLRNLTARYPTKRYIATDNIMPNDYYKTFLPQWAKERPRDMTIFYEIRPTINEEQMKALTDAGVIYSVPGIESLSSNLLRVFQKGSRAIQNVHFLKLARMYGMYPLWNLLIHVPGEKEEDYTGMAELFPKIVHYMPPFGGARDVEIHRFSPYFNQWQDFAENIRPRPWYSDIYPAEQLDLSQVAYYFDADWRDTLPEEARKPTVDATWTWIDAWRDNPRIPGLTFDALRLAPDLELWDTRHGGQRKFELDAREAAIYHAVREPLGLSKVVERLGDKWGSEEAIKGILDDFVGADIVLEEAGRYLALAIPETSPEPDQSTRQNMLNRVGQEAER
jgi:ribosomal peptide maturation radical SAM protein 1